ncbi:MAG: hypothetical protein QM737_19675 [Ferruginibacter sp.]
MTFKNRILAALLVVGNTCFGQTTNVLELNTQKNFSESNLISIDSSFKLKQELCYDGGIDISYCLLFTLIFNDISTASQLKKIDVSKEDSTVKCIFNLRFAWHPEDKKTVISGFITIEKWTKRSVEIDFDVKVYDESVKNTYIYSGKRIFTKTKRQYENKWMWH